MEDPQHSITAEGLEELKSTIDKRKDHTPDTRPSISKDHENFQEAVEYLSTKLFQSTDDQVYIQSHYLGEQIGASAYEVSPIIRSIRDGDVEGLGAERVGSNQRCKKWRVYWDRDGS